MKGDPSPTWLRLRLFAVLTAGKGNGTGVYAEIFVSLILHFFVFNFLIFFVNSLIFSVLFFYTHTIYPKRFLFHKINILQLFSTYLFYFFFLYYFFTHDIYPHSRLTTSTHYPRHLATLINIWLIWVRQQKRRYNMDQNQEQVLF